jgi:hypothetical protein
MVGRQEAGLSGDRVGRTTQLTSPGLARLSTPGARALCSLLLAGLLSACNGTEEGPPAIQTELVPQLQVGAADMIGRSSRRDFWTEELGDYLQAEELDRYWQAEQGEQRFERFALSLLEARLRQDLLLDHRWLLTRAQVEAYCALQDYDQSASYLEQFVPLGPAGPSSEGR